MRGNQGPLLSPRQAAVSPASHGIPLAGGFSPTPAVLRPRVETVHRPGLSSVCTPARYAAPHVRCPVLVLERGLGGAPHSDHLDIVPPEDDLEYYYGGTL